MSRKILKMMFLLSVSILVLAGCGKQETETVAETEITTEAKSTQENSTQEETQMTETTPAETEKEEETQPPVETESTEVPETTTGNGSEKREDNKQTQQTEQPAAAHEPSEPEEPAQSEEPAQPEKPEPVSYDPQRVVELAVEQTKAQGKTYIPDDLSQMLANGEISQEDYDACYPADGAGYLEYYVATDMNEARDISGTVKFSSESDIAANIAGMYAALPQQYFYIEYHGTVMYGDRECYVFYCYRA